MTAKSQTRMGRIALRGVIEGDVKKIDLTPHPPQENRPDPAPSL
jgi:hypothetical protein